MNDISTGPQAVHYLPIVTTLMAVVFCAVLIKRYRVKGTGTHLIWWALGVFFYGVGTALEGSITIFGNSIALTKAWYIAGALLGGYPLATGTVYLLLQRRTANLLTALSLPVIVILSILVILSPVNLGALEAHRPGGAILGWQWIRLGTPIVNIYAMIFLVGGAMLSSYRLAKHQSTMNRAIGNAFIAFGAMLPAVGGSMAKAGIVEALYVGEFVGLIGIWIGYAFCVRPLQVSEPVTVPREFIREQARVEDVAVADSQSTADNVEVS